LLAAELEALCARLPGGSLDAAGHARVRAVREAVRFRAAVEPGVRLWESAGSTAWTVLLLPRLDSVAVRTRELSYAHRLGQELWGDPLGLAGGYPLPQFPTHRGELPGEGAASRHRLGHRSYTLSKPTGAHLIRANRCT